MTCGDSGLAGGRLSQTIPTSSAGLERDRLAILALVGLRVGEEPLSRLLAQPALGHEAAQDQRRLERLAPLRLGALERRERRRRGPARRRARTGPGRIPAPIIIPISMSLTEATPSSRTRQDSTSAFSAEALDQRLGGCVRSAAVLIEPLSGLLAEVARLDELLHLRRARRSGRRSDRAGARPRAARCRGPSRSARKNGPIGARLRLLDDLVDLLDVEPLLVDVRQISDTAELRMRLTTKPGHLAAADRASCGSAGRSWTAAWSVSSEVSSPSIDLDQPHHRRGVEEVEADDLVRPAAWPRPSR